jgi:hypothetical protein
MDRVTNDLPFIFVYLDDIIVGSPDLASHLQHLQLLVQRLRDFGLVINGEKCEFGAEELDFLDHRVSAEGVVLLKKKGMLEHPQPQTVQDLQVFLGTVNFFRRFPPAAASLLQPLTDALSGEAKAKDRVPWSTEMEAAFSSIKTALASAALLAHPAPVRRSSSWWTPPRTTWERPYSSGPHPLQTGSRWYFSQRSSIPPSSDTLPLTGNCWPAQLGSSTSATCLMDVSSLYSPTTSPSLSPWPRLLTPRCSGRAAPCPT